MKHAGDDITQCISELDRRELGDNALARELQDSVTAKCTTDYAEMTARKLCENRFDARHAVDTLRVLDHYPLLLPTSQRDYHELFDAGTSIFPRLSTALTDDNVFILTDIISGYVGVIGFGVSQMIVVSNVEAETPAGSDSVRRVTKDVLALINNGGTLSATLQYPIFAGGGANLQHGFSIYAQAGLLGPLAESDSLRFSAALVGEYARMMAIRAPDTTAALLGEVFVGIRLGAGYVPESIWLGVNDDKLVPFLQLGLGLRQKGAFTVSVLWTWVPPGKESRAFVPKLMLGLGLQR